MNSTSKIGCIGKQNGVYCVPTTPTTVNKGLRDLFNIGIPILLLILLIILIGGPILSLLSWLRIRKLEQRILVLEGLGIKPNAKLPETSLREAGDSEFQAVFTEEQPQTDDAEGSGAAKTSTSAESQKPIEEESAQSAEPVEIARPKKSIEERLGGSWAVWVGGLALFLGGIFLVNFAFEEDLIGDGARVILGGILAIIVISFAEWLRRRTSERNLNYFASAYIPGILTLVGTTTAFATTYAAHSLYGFIGDAVAFAIFGLVALSTLVAAILHGPAVGSYGLVASYVVPFLVSSNDPSLLPLAIYGLFVSLAAYSVARLRLWRWLALSAVAGSLFWGSVLSFAAEIKDAGTIAFYSIAAIAMASFVFLTSLHARDAGMRVLQKDWTAVIAIGLHSFLFYFLVQVDDFSIFSLTVTCLACMLLLMLASEWPVASPLAYFSAGLALLSMLSFDVYLHPQDMTTRAPELFPRIASAFSNQEADRLLSFGTVIVLLMGAGGFIGVLRSSGRTALATASMLVPIGVVMIAYFRVAEFDTSAFFGSTSIVLALVLLSACVYLEKFLPSESPSRNGSIVAYSIGTVAALVTGFGILLEHGWFTLSIALIALGVAWVGQMRNMPALPWISVVVSAVCIVAIGIQPTIVGINELSPTPIFNWLLVGYGVPAIAFGTAAWLLSHYERRLPQDILASMCIFMSLLTAIVQIHHIMNPDNFYAAADTLAERSLITLVFLAGSLSLQFISFRKFSYLYEHSSTLLGIIGFAILALDHLYLHNPYNTGESIGEGMVFNLNLSGYLLPAVFAGLIAHFAQSRKPNWYVRSAGVISLLFLFAYSTLQVSTFYQGPELNFSNIMASEKYTYSAVWLLLGFLLLIAGLLRNAQSLRLGSAFIVIITVFKVFLFDMSELEGVLRALSFLGLGAVLVGIGLIYQRLLIPRTKQDAPLSEPGTG